MTDEFDAVLDDSRLDRKRLHHTLGVKKISEGVFDEATLKTLYDLSKRGKLTELKGIVSTGKEANVYWGKLGGRGVAVKIYAVEASDFRNMTRYIQGDPRFKVGRDRRKLIYTWATKEFKNLKRVHDKVRCPEPLAVHNNVLVMEFIGREGLPAPKLKDVEVREPDDYLQTLLSYIKKMFELKLVHSDFSEYNVLDLNGEPVVIDYSAGVVLEHPEAGAFLERDVKNILRFFKGRGVERDLEEVLNYVKGGG